VLVASSSAVGIKRAFPFEAFVLLHQPALDAVTDVVVEAREDLARTGAEAVVVTHPRRIGLSFRSKSSSDRAVVDRLVSCFTTYRKSARLCFGISTLGIKPNRRCHLWRIR
jgi:hypothetical protein